ncbi:hypothetical protein MSSIH_3292 [Methanosarcina siciliae HI350]|uniref:Uncharacterized protein n=1 Tax=Methanosarcina siciliae HI350 TaxID=1434119 RepID=A0A0E3PHJ8_9EURY|nr:DUF5320 domain-containing protein [Methanosarcina siciliae]AKB33982.1 hypothetical protein MSSIH_3292 [Methanosarcina siciliae HI350]
MCCKGEHHTNYVRSAVHCTTRRHTDRECGCGCGRPRFLSKNERAETLEGYREELKRELEGVEEELKKLKGN